MNNSLLLLEISLSLALIFVIGRILYLRANREKVLKSYKKNPDIYSKYVKLMTTQRLVISSIAAIVVVVKTALDIRNGIQKGGANAQEIAFILKLAVVFFLITVAIIYYIAKRNERTLKR